MGVTNTAERLARNKFVSFFGWWSLDSRGKEQIKAQIRESQDIINPVADLYTTHEQKETFMRKQLPKIFIRYAFCRNLVLIWGAMHCYNMYYATKKDTYR